MVSERQQIWRVARLVSYEADDFVSYHLTEGGAEKQRLKILRQDLKNHRSCLDEKGKALKEKMDDYKRSVQGDYVKHKIKVLP